MDELGYGIALKGSEVAALNERIEEQKNVKIVKFTNLKDGFKTYY